MMRFVIETWAPEFGSPTDDAAMAEAVTDVDPWVEASTPDQWQPLPVRPDSDGRLPSPVNVLFVDGVRRVEANVWITDDSGESHQGICASYAAGAVLCNGSAELVGAEVRRGLFTTSPVAETISTRHGDFTPYRARSDLPNDLSVKLQTTMASLEGQVAIAHRSLAELVVVDGPLKDGQDQPGFVGYVKTHARAYGPPLVRETVAALGVDERTPLFSIGGPKPKLSWYQRLPCAVEHGWAGIVRLETTGDQDLADVVAIARCLEVTLPRFASAPQKDARAPQNLYPIGGLERDLRRRLGDPALMFRALRAAAVATT
jgi:hypothetical protein